jgi:hypothetical protein
MWQRRLKLNQIRFRADTVGGMSAPATSSPAE